MALELTSLMVGTAGVGAGTALATAAATDQGCADGISGTMGSADPGSGYSLAEPPPAAPSIMTGRLFAPETRGKDSQEVTYTMTMEVTARLRPHQLRDELKAALTAKKMGSAHASEQDFLS